MASSAADFDPLEYVSGGATLGQPEAALLGARRPWFEESAGVVWTMKLSGLLPQAGRGWFLWTWTMQFSLVLLMLIRIAQLQRMITKQGLTIFDYASLVIVFEVMADVCYLVNTWALRRMLHRRSLSLLFRELPEHRGALRRFAVGTVVTAVVTVWLSCLIAKFFAHQHYDYWIGPWKVSAGGTGMVFMQVLFLTLLPGTLMPMGVAASLLYESTAVLRSAFEKLAGECAGRQFAEPAVALREYLRLRAHVLQASAAWAPSVLSLMLCTLLLSVQQVIYRAFEIDTTSTWPIALLAAFVTLLVVGGLTTLNDQVGDVLLPATLAQVWTARERHDLEADLRRAPAAFSVYGLIVDRSVLVAVVVGAVSSVLSVL